MYIMSREMILVPKEKYNKLLETAKLEKTYQQEHIEEHENITNEEANEKLQKPNNGAVSKENPENVNLAKPTENIQSHDIATADRKKNEKR